MSAQVITGISSFITMAATACLSWWLQRGSSRRRLRSEIREDIALREVLPPDSVYAERLQRRVDANLERLEPTALPPVVSWPWILAVFLGALGMIAFFLAAGLSDWEMGFMSVMIGMLGGSVLCAVAITRGDAIMALRPGPASRLLLPGAEPGL